MKTSSKKTVECCECERKIPPGEFYVRNEGHNEHGGYNVGTCTPCDALREEVHLSGVVYDAYFGSLFEGYLELVRRDKSMSIRQVQRQVADRKERHRAGVA